MLDGQGADELLAGYRSFFAFFFADLLRHGRVPGACVRGRRLPEVRELRSSGHDRRARETVRPGRACVACCALAGTARRVSCTRTCAPRIARCFRWASRTFPDRLRSQLHLVLERRLPELLHAEDRNSMAHSLEARVPFLDHRLVELLFSLDASHVIEGGRTKMVLRRALADLLPPLVAGRVDKIGFATPEARWFRGNLGLFALDVFGSREFEERGFVDRVRLADVSSGIAVGSSKPARSCGERSISSSGPARSSTAAGCPRARGEDRPKPIRQAIRSTLRRPDTGEIREPQP